MKENEAELGPLLGVKALLNVIGLSVTWLVSFGVLADVVAVFVSMRMSGLRLVKVAMAAESNLPVTAAVSGRGAESGPNSTGGCVVMAASGGSNFR